MRVFPHENALLRKENSPSLPFSWTVVRSRRMAFASDLAENHLAEHGEKVDTSAQCTTYVKHTRSKKVFSENKEST